MEQSPQRVEHQEVTRRSGYVSQELTYRWVDCSGCAWKAQCTRGDGHRTLRHIPRLASHQAEARRRLLSEQGVVLRRRRLWEVETPFAMMKKNLGFTRLHLRGWAKATLEVGYLMTALNLIRLHHWKPAAASA